MRGARAPCSAIISRGTCAVAGARGIPGNRTEVSGSTHNLPRRTYGVHIISRARRRLSRSPGSCHIASRARRSTRRISRSGIVPWRTRNRRTRPGIHRNRHWNRLPPELRHNYARTEREERSGIRRDDRRDVLVGFDIGTGVSLLQSRHHVRNVRPVRREARSGIHHRIRKIRTRPVQRFPVEKERTGKRIHADCPAHRRAAVRNDARNGEDVDRASRGRFSRESAVVSPDKSNRRIPRFGKSGINQRFYAVKTRGALGQFPFVFRLDLIRLPFRERRIYVLSIFQRIDGPFVDSAPGDGPLEILHDIVPNRPLVPYRTTGIRYRECIIGDGIVSRCGHADVQRLGYLGRIADSRRVTGLGRISPDSKKPYGTEDGEYGNYHDKLYKGKTFEFPKLRSLHDGFRKNHIGEYQKYFGSLGQILRDAKEYRPRPRSMM